MFKLVVFAVCVVFTFAEHKAIVQLSGKNVLGTVHFIKRDTGIQVEGTVTGLTPGEHGFHVHQYGNLEEGCTSTGGHFNPENKTHGARTALVRHVGDLGNIVADDNGVAIISFIDTVIDLAGPHDIIGRAIVVHADQDDYGLSDASDSLTTGHAGGRVACGIIGRM